MDALCVPGVRFNVRVNLTADLGPPPYKILSEANSLVALGVESVIAGGVKVSVRGVFQCF